MPSPADIALVVRFDHVVDGLLDRVRGHQMLDRAMYGTSEAGNFSLIWHVLAWLPVLLGRQHPRRALAISSALVIESVIVNGGIKSLFKRERPKPPEPRPHRLRSPTTSSFPSGHASAAVVAATLLSRSRRDRPYYVALAGVVAGSRAYVRIHHASDVVGGGTVGVVLAMVARRTLRRYL